MTSTIRISGPVHIFVSFPNRALQDFRYLGTCEQSPILEEQTFFKALNNDIAGDSLPLDETWEGLKMIVSCVLTRYDEKVFSLIRQSILAGANNAQAGYEGNQDRGSTTYGRLTFRLALYNSFYNTPNQNIDDLPGYLFYFAKYAGSKPIPGGTSVNKLVINFDCVSGYMESKPSVGNQSPSVDSNVGGKFYCYTTEASDFDFLSLANSIN